MHLNVIKMYLIYLNENEYKIYSYKDIHDITFFDKNFKIKLIIRKHVLVLPLIIHNVVSYLIKDVHYLIII